MGCRASLAVTKSSRHGERSAATQWLVMASAVRPSTAPSWRAQRGHPLSRHGERSAAIHCPVMASTARPSIFEVRGDGLPRFARSDG